MIDCDFIPTGYHQRQSLRGRVRIHASLIGTMIVIIVLWAVFHHHQVAQAEAMLVEVADQHSQLDIDFARKEVMEAERRKLERRQQLLAALEARASLTLVLSDISRRMPESIVLTRLDAHCPSVARYAIEETAEPVEPDVKNPIEIVPPGEKPAKVVKPQHRQVTITGIAVDSGAVIELAAALERSPLYERVQMDLKGPASWAGRHGEAFELTCYVLDQRREKR